MINVDRNRVREYRFYRFDTDNPIDKAGYYGLMDKFTEEFIGVSPLYKDQTPIKISNVSNYHGSVWDHQSVSLGKGLMELLYSFYEKLDTKLDIIDELKKELEELYAVESPDSVLIGEKLGVFDKLLKDHEILESINISKEVILDGLRSEHLYEDYFRSMFSFPVVVREGYRDYKVESEIVVTKELLNEIKEELLGYPKRNVFFNYKIIYTNNVLTLHVSYVFKDIDEDKLAEHVEFLKKIVSINESRVN